MNNIILCEPLGYLEFTCLEIHAKFVITDSGGIQEETSALGIPCYTLRPNTERPSTLIENGGTNSLIKRINEINDDNYEFISFGNTCLPAGILKYANLKTKSYPLVPVSLTKTN